MKRPDGLVDTSPLASGSSGGKRRWPEHDELDGAVTGFAPLAARTLGRAFRLTERERSGAAFAALLLALRFVPQGARLIDGRYSSAVAVQGDGVRTGIRLKREGRDRGPRRLNDAAAAAYERALLDVLAELRNPVSGDLLVERVDGVEERGRSEFPEPDLYVTWRVAALLQLARHHAVGLVPTKWFEP